MINRLSIKQKIVGIILIVLFLVSTVGILTYRQFSKVLVNVSEATKPDLRINMTKNLLFDLTQAENSVKTYTLTHDSLYLDQYQYYSDKIATRLVSLNDLNKESKIKEIDFDTLENLIVLKFEVLDELLTLQNEFRVVEALEKVSEKLGEVAETEVQTPEKTEQKKSLFKWKNRSKNKDKTEEAKAKPNLNIEEVNKNILEIKQLETSKEESQLERELELLMFDKKNTSKIQKILRDLEAADIKRTEEKAAETEQAVKMTNIQILIFCIVICLLLLFMSYTIVQYISNSNRYKKVLKNAKNEAESLAKAKEHFVATVSHEIRTPMNIISGFAEQISQTDLNEKQREQVGTILKASSHLLNLINEVLDFTKLQNNKLDLEESGFKPREVIKEVVDLMMPLAHAKELKTSLEFDPAIPEILIGDAFRMRQILFNIIGNAVKFTNSGRISVEVSPLLRSNTNVRLRISVTDTGIGMNSSKIDRVFEEFEQAEVSTTRTYGGTGLGLSITKKLVELQKGSIDITSELDEGTTVIIEIPYSIGDENDLDLSTSSNVSGINLSGYKILIVDDERFNRKLLQTILEKYNASITEAKNGVEAVKEVEKNEYDLILMDARMPEMDGITAAREINEKNAVRQIKTPIIALTAAVTEVDRKSYREAGMIEFIAKPFKEAELVEKILTVLDLKEEVAVQLPQINGVVTGQLIDFSDLQRISGNDTEFYVEMLNTFVESTREGIQNIKDACKEERWLDAAESAHKISAPCRHLSADNLYGHLKEMEIRCREEENPGNLDDLVEKIEEEARMVLREIELELTQYSD